MQENYATALAIGDANKVGIVEKYLFNIYVDIVGKYLFSPEKEKCD